MFLDLPDQDSIVRCTNQHPEPTPDFSVFIKGVRTEIMFAK
jgi:hypothetical protein